MDEKISKLFLPLLDKLYNLEPAGEPFRKPVDVVKYGCFDYYLYVKHPIDLSTIRERLVNHQYHDAWRFIADIQLMFANAYLFNKKHTIVWEFTNKLNKVWNSEVAPIMQRLNYCCGQLHKFGPQLLFCHGTTPDRYCQIPIGAKYKCYQDQYSFCMPCFNKIDTEYISIQGLSCETTRMKLPTQPVKRSDFIDCANDNWQYESFIQCIQCTRRIHQICELYPADEDEIERCLQHNQVELEQKALCQVPEEYRTETEDVDKQTDSLKQPNGSQIATGRSESQNERERPIQNDNIELNASATSLDDELLQFARDVDDSHSTCSAPSSPSFERNKNCFENIRDGSNKVSHLHNNFDDSSSSKNISNFTNFNLASNAKNSVDKIAARLSINKMTNDNSTDEQQKICRSKFVCNHCYRKQKIGFNLRHRKYSARRLPHTRMSKYIETKVNEHIRENSPSAGEVTIRVLTAYRDIIEVKPEMKDYIRRSREKDPSQHPNLSDYPDEFAYTNRAIFAWQEIDGVDVCVFGMHIQEYGEDCPEPNRQVIYLSYLDSVHFFRPKQVRTAVYHEILLSYFKYVKKLGFRRVFIWVCPSRKGDDYIFYRHPTEQKMPTLKRLADWYVSLLDKGIMAGIVEKHQNIHQYASTQNWNSILSMPYLSGDYWPGEFERLLNIMIESQKEYEFKLTKDRRDVSTQPLYISEFNDGRTDSIKHNNATIDRVHDRRNLLLSSNVYQNSSNGKNFNSLMNSLGLKPASGTSDMSFMIDGDYNSFSINEESKLFDNLTEDSSRSEYDQPLDLSKGSTTTSPESYLDDDLMSEVSFKTSSRKKRRRSSTLGSTKRRNRASTQVPMLNLNRTLNDVSIRSNSQALKVCRKSNTQIPSGFDNLISPEEEMIKNLERSLKRQREGFIVARLNECDCSPHFETQRRKEEAFVTCDLMKGREPFLQLARLKNYEFSTLRRAKFSSLAMVKHLSKTFKLEPICNECFSFDSSKRHLACSYCDDFYLCTSCHDNTQHEHIMSLVAPPNQPDIDEFLQQCSLSSNTNSISSASSTISNKSFNEALDTSIPSVSPTLSRSLNNAPLNRHLLNRLSSATMPLSCQRQKNRGCGPNLHTRAEDEENAKICPCGTSEKICLAHQTSPPSDNSPNNIRLSSNLQIELDQVLIENFMRQAEVSYDVDFDQMKNESKKLLTHYWTCPVKESCHKCKFVVLSCSFMNVLMRSTRLQMLINCDPSETMPNTNSNHLSGVNLTTANRFGYQPKDK